MTSSVRLGMAAQEKAKKAAQREAENAAKKGKESEDDQQQHSKAKVGGASAKAGSGDSSVGSKRVRARTKKGHFVKDDPSTPENEAWVEVKPAKAPAKKAGRSRAKVQQDS